MPKQKLHNSGLLTVASKSSHTRPPYLLKNCRKFPEVIWSTVCPQKHSYSSEERKRISTTTGSNIAATGYGREAIFFFCCRWGSLQRVTPLIRCHLELWCCIMLYYAVLCWLCWLCYIEFAIWIHNGMVSYTAPRLTPEGLSPLHREALVWPAQTRRWKQGYIITQ